MLSRTDPAHCNPWLAACYCNTLADFAGVRAPYKSNKCVPAAPTPANVLASYTFTVRTQVLCALRSVH